MNLSLAGKFDRFKEIYKISGPFYKFLGPAKLSFYLGLTIVFSIFSTLNYIALLPFVGIALSGKSEFFDKYIAANFPILDTPFLRDNIFLVMSGTVILIYVLKFLCGLWFCGISGKYQESYGLYLRRQLAKKFIAESFHRLNSAKIDYIFEFNLVSKVVSINWAFINFHIKVVTSVFTLFILIAYKVDIVLFVFLFAVIWFSILMPILKTSRRSAMAFYRDEKSMNQFFYEQLTSLEIIKVFRLEGKREQDLNQLSQNLIQSGVKIGVARQAASSIQELLVVAFATLALVIASYFSVPAEEVVVFGYLFSRLLGNLNEAISVVSNGIELLPAVESLKARGVVDFRPVIAEVKVPSKLNSIQLKELKIQNFSIRTPQGTILENANISFLKGDKVQVIGPNGVGKSTFIKSIGGFVPFTGSISFDGEVQSSVEGKYYDYISYSPQDPSFFHGTIIENITLFNPDKERALLTLLQNLNIDLEAIFTDWKNYIVTDNGASLSGGQRQLLNVLRALLKDAPILILDEYTNHLSPKLIEKISDYLRTLNDKIILTVSHTELSYINRKVSMLDKRLSVV